MSWFTPILLTHDERRASAPVAADSFGLTLGVGLGSARASAQWAWSSEPAVPARSVTTATAQPQREGASLRAPVELLRQMSEAACAQGRSESDVWIEAAREWLRRRETEPFAPPAAPAPAPVRSGAPRRPSRVWDDIDALLIALRAPAALADHEDIPAA